MRKKPKYTIEEIRERIVPIAKQHNKNVARVFLFGSYARGDAKAASDVDFRMDVKSETGYFELAEIYYDVQKVLKTKIDLVTTGGCDEAFLNKIKNEEVLLYAE